MRQILHKTLRLRACMMMAMLIATVTGAWADDATDVLDQTVTGIDVTSYKTFSDKQATSEAVYAGNCAGSYSSIQLRSNNNNSGIVTTTSGGKVKSITVTWNSNTSNGRTLNVYGKNSAYSDATDLYNSSTQGTPLGTIVCGTSTSLTIDGDYEYIGFRSDSGAMYLTSVTIVWTTDGGSDTPTPTPTEKKACDLALTDAPIALTFDMHDNSGAQVIHYTTSSTGEVSVAAGQYDVSCSVNATQKTITVTPLAVTNGEQTVTVNQAADDNYEAGSVTFTVKVTDSTPAEDPDPQPQTDNEETITFSENGYANGEEVTEVKGTDCTITFDNGTNNNNAPKYYTSGTAVRAYGGNTFTVSSDNRITKIELTFGSSGDGSNTITADNGTYEDGIWTGDAKSVTFTIGGTSGNRRIASIAVTYTADASDTRAATTTTIDATGITNTNVFNDTAAGRLTATVAAGETTIDNAAITWSGNNDDVAIIAANGTVTLVGAGEVTFTATYAGDETNYKGSSATYKLTVINNDPNAPGTLNKPYTVADAIEAIEAGTGITDVYATGIVSAIVTAYNSQFGNITYNISADGSTDGNQLQAYRGKSYNGDNFTSADDIQVGDEVVIFGTLKKYNTTYEFDQNNQLVSLNRVEKQEAGLSFGETTEFTVTLGDQFTAPTLINPNQLEGIVYISNNTEVASVDSGTGVVEIVGVGQATITVSFRGDDTYKAGSASYTLTVESGLQDNDLAITAPESTTLTVGDELQLTYTTSADGELTWESSNDAVLTVDEEGTVTAVAAGTATITLTQEASNNYDGGEASIEFTVKKATPAGTESDELNRKTTEITGTSYTAWSGKCVSSDAVYAGNSAGGNESIQLRSNNNNSGIVSTTSGGTIFNVEVEWNKSTTTGRTLNVYGSNTAYESAEDLYDSEKQGTLLGTIVYGTSTSLEVDGDYAYVGIRSASGAMYLTAVTFTWATSSKASAGFSFGETTAFNVLPGAEFTAPTLTTAEGFDGTIVYSSSDEDIALVDESTGDVVIGEKEGTATITASAEGTDNFKAGSASYTITVKAPEKAENGLAFDKESVEANIGEDFSAPALTNPNQLTVTYSSSNENLATVDENTGEVTIGNTVGNVTITATFAGNDEFKAGSASYTINIIDPNNQPTYYALVAEYNGKHYAMNDKGGTPWGATEVDAVNGKVVNGKSDELSWTINEYVSYTSFKNKKSDKYLCYKSSGTEFTDTNSGDNHKWTANAEHDTWTNQNGKTSGTVRTMLYNDGTGFKNYATSNANGKGYSDYTHKYTFADGYVRDVTAGNWGTFCADHTIAAEDYSGVTFYSIAGKTVDAQNEPVSIVLQEAGELMAGAAYIFQANEGATKLIAAYSEENVNEPFLASDNNGLVGSLDGTAVAEGMYLLSGGKVVKCGTGCNIAANRAYIDMSQVPVVDTSAAGVKLGIGDITVGIDGIQREGTTGSIYNIAGQRMSKLQRGLNIVDGKKILVK